MSFDHIVFDSWQVLARTLFIGVLAYIGLIVLIRASGKRTLAKMNAFDFVVTVALGSTLASILLNKDVTLAQGLLAFAVLIGLQFAITWSSVRIGAIRKLVTGEPALLLYRGNFLQQALRASRVTEGEVRAAIRGAGVADLSAAEAVVLETDGSFSVVRRDADTASSLDDVPGPRPHLRADAPSR